MAIRDSQSFDFRCPSMTTFGHAVLLDYVETPMMHRIGEDADAVAQNPIFDV